METYDLTEENLNPNVKRMDYIEGGTCAQRAKEIEKEMKEGKKFPFTEIIRANVGDLQGNGSPPITFIKQVIALVHYPELKNSTNYPSDVQERAQDILNECSNKASSAYTATIGLDIVRRHIAEFITRRDNVVTAKMEDIVLCAGSINCIRVIFKLFADQCKPAIDTTDITSRSDVAGIMFSVPLYSLFSAVAFENGLYKILFYSNESKDWEIELDVLKKALENGRRFSDPRAIYIVNPSNPTGSVLTRENIELIIKFANREKLLVVADEIYQDNIYTVERPFISFRKVMYEMDKKYQNTQMISVHSASKGFSGEAGIRAGYIELLNLDKEVRDLLEKSISTTLMPTVLGQATLSCIVKPPTKDQPSYDLYIKESTNILSILTHKAKTIRDGLNSIPGITCTPFYGSMCVLPSITIPPKAVQAAKDKNQTPDVFYCFDMLENVGVLVIPASEFGQRDKTYHFRIANLPPTVKVGVMLERIKRFNAQFLEKYK